MGFKDEQWTLQHQYFYHFSTVTSIVKLVESQQYDFTLSILLHIALEMSLTCQPKLHNNNLQRGAEGKCMKRKMEECRETER